VGDPEGFIGRSAIEKAGTILAPDTSLQWTDDYSSLLKVLTR
jgi:hypothetical protein